MATPKSIKKSTNTQPTIIEMTFSWATYITIFAAVLYGLFWVVMAFVDSDSTMVNNFGNLLFTITVLGGISMGILYLFKTMMQR